MNKFTKWFYNLQRIPAAAKIFTLQNLAVMIRTGLPLADALETLAKQNKNVKLKLILDDAQKQIRTGKTFSESLNPYKKDFDEMFINMIKAGEISGNLEKVLNHLYIQTKKANTLKNKIRNAMTYPVIIVCAMFGIGTFVMIYVLPNIISIFNDIGSELPLPTRILIMISNFISSNGIIIGLAILLFLVIFFRWIKTKSGKFLWHRFLLHLPIAGEIIKKINITSTAQNLSSLIQTDISVPESFQITSKIVNNNIYKKALEEAAENVKNGKKIAEILSNYPEIFPPIFIQMITVGEETGTLDEVLKNLADFYQEEVEQTMENLPVIIEPLLMILMGLGVAGLAIAVILPIYSMTQNF